MPRAYGLTKRAAIEAHIRQASTQWHTVPSLAAVCHASASLVRGVVNDLLINGRVARKMYSVPHGYAYKYQWKGKE